MATTAAGTPYVESSDLVANYPGVSLALANHIDTSTGKVLQVVHGSTSTQVISTATTMVDTNLTATITPSSATSRILVLFFQNGCDKSSPGTLTSMRLRLMRDATNVGQFAYFAGWTSTSSELKFANLSGSELDLPNTTSAVVYKTQFANEVAGSGQISVNNNAKSSITLMEISA